MKVQVLLKIPTQAVLFWDMFVNIIEFPPIKKGKEKEFLDGFPGQMLSMKNLMVLYQEDYLNPQKLSY